ncbi:MAG: flagellar basal body protein, partial [Syntrophales bacterium LBB04]|nr:flagellar basal body protein [Syntrophales bacterium LBB04]
MSLSSLMNVSRNALQSYQMAIDVTGGNIANINTPGYSRERAVLNSVGSVNMNTDNGQIGVNVASVERVYDEYLDNQIVGQTQVLGYNQKKSDVLSGIEGIFAENGSGASDLLSKFWNA